jgi:hypothetical protein
MKDLNRQIEDLRMIRGAQGLEILRLREQIRELRRSRGEPEPDGVLKGLRVAVIGPSYREDDYRLQLEALGARVEFAPAEEKVALTTQACTRAHGIVFITTLTTHKVEGQILKVVGITGKPYEKLTFKGVARLVDVVVAMAPDMRAYKELVGECKSRSPTN